MKPALLRAIAYSILVVGLALSGRPLLALLCVAATLLLEAVVLMHGLRPRGSARLGLLFLIVPLTFPLVPTPRYHGDVTRQTGDTNEKLIRRAEMRAALDMMCK